MWPFSVSVCLPPLSPSVSVTRHTCPSHAAHFFFLLWPFSLLLSRVTLLTSSFYCGPSHFFFLLWFFSPLLALVTPLFSLHVLRPAHAPLRSPLLPVGRKVDVRLPEKGNSKSHGARPFHLIITMIKWIRTSRLSRKNPPLFLCSIWGRGFRESTNGRGFRVEVQGPQMLHRKKGGFPRQTVEGLDKRSFGGKRMVASITTEVPRS